MNLCKKLVDDGSVDTYYGLDAATAYALGWQGVVTLGAGDGRGMNVHPTTTGGILKEVVRWPATDEPLLVRLVRERIVSPPCAMSAIARFRAAEVDYKQVEAACEAIRAANDVRAENEAASPSVGAATK